MHQSAKLRRGSLLFLLAWFAFCLWLAAQIPYTHDDWDWGLSNGIEQLLTASINSRYVGNLIIVALTRSVLLKDLVMALTFTLLPFAALRFLQSVLPLAENGAQPDEGFSLAALAAGSLFLLLMPTPVWQQTCGWVSGFANYIVLALGLLVFLRAAAVGFLREETPRELLFSPVLLFLFGAAVQLLLENAALYILLVALCLYVYRILRWRRWHDAYLALLLGVIAGTVVMFSSPIYGTLIETGEAVDATRDLLDYEPGHPLRFLLGGLRRVALCFVPGIFEECRVLAWLVLLLLSALLLTDKALRARWLFFAGNLLFAAYYLALPRLRALPFAETTLGLGLLGLLGCAFFAWVLLETALLLRAHRTLALLLAGLWLSAAVLVAPLAFTNVHGYRITDFFHAQSGRIYSTPYLLLLLFCLPLGWLLRERLAGRGRKLLAGLLCAALAAAVLRWGIVYAAVGQCSRERLALIREAREGRTQSIVLPAYPYPEVLWMPDPEGVWPNREVFFRAFYEIPEDVALSFSSKMDAPGETP